MEILSHFAEAFSDGVDRFPGVFTSLFQYLISIGVRQETLILILIGGISFPLIALLIYLSKISTKRPLLPRVKSSQGTERVKNSSRFSAMFSSKADLVEKSDKPAGGASGKSFTIFKKKTKLSRDKYKDRDAESLERSGDGKTDQGGDNVVSKLAEIERDMLALKELYQAGHINVNIYVNESKVLYEKAKALS